MIDRTRPFLLTILQHALSAGATEVRFVSGRYPAFTIDGKLSPADSAETRAALVQAIHEVCLNEAKTRGVPVKNEITYTAVLSGVGEFQCHFRTNGDARSLSLRQAPNEGMLETQQTRVAPPAAGDTAEPDGSEYS